MDSAMEKSVAEGKIFLHPSMGTSYVYCQCLWRYFRLSLPSYKFSQNRFVFCCLLSNDLAHFGVLRCTRHVVWKRTSLFTCYETTRFDQRRFEGQAVAGAKAQHPFVALSARLKSCPV